MVALKERIQCSASSIAAASSGEREKWRWSTQGAPGAPSGGGYGEKVDDLGSNEIGLEGVERLE